MKESLVSDVKGKPVTGVSRKTEKDSRLLGQFCNPVGLPV